LRVETEHRRVRACRGPRHRDSGQGPDAFEVALVQAAAAKCACIAPVDLVDSARTQAELGRPEPMRAAPSTAPTLIRKPGEGRNHPSPSPPP
jgi:hypothetical protein